MSGPASDPDRPNILLVIMDTARADHFGPWGGRARTPIFDDLASRGVVIPNARSAAPWTVPSHASLFSGLYPFEHGVTGAAIGDDARLRSLRPAIMRNAERWIPVAMRDSGYRTFGISANTWITEPMGFDLGFDAFHPVGPAKMRPRGGSSIPRTGGIYRLPPPVRAALKRPIRALVSRPRRQISDAREGRDFGSLEAVTAIATEARRGGEPFFGFVNIIEPHAPYLPPRDCNPLRGLRRLRAPKLVRRYLMDVHSIAYNAGAAEIPDEAMAMFRELYAGEIAYTDRFLGRMLDALETNAVLDETLIVVTSDHGENLGEDHLVGHQASLDDRLLHVPLIFAGPGAPEPPPIPGIFPMTSVPWAIARAAGIQGPWEAPGPVAVSQLRPGTLSLKLVDAADRFRLTPAQRGTLQRSIEQATDGVTTLTIDTPGAERTDGPASGVPALRRAIEAARGPELEPPADEGFASAQEQAEIEAHLSDLGYI